MGAYSTVAGMRLPGSLIAFVLMLMLAVMTPVGTGAGVHQFDLLHPLFSHVHLFKGRFLTHEQMEAEMAAVPSPTEGVSIGSGAGAGDEAGGVGISPTLPAPPALVPLSVGVRWDVLDTGKPAGREEPPPDPPPL